MHEPSVEILLRSYVNEGSDAAFTKLVQRCTGFVHATARRRVGGDAHLAYDVTQLVFVDLARKAPTLIHGTVIAGWLHHHTCFRAATFVRSERRRRTREERAAEIEKIDHEGDDFWKKLEPWLDHALESLPSKDRDAIVLRFFAGEALAGLGAKLGITEDAAQKRVTRALERLRSSFARRGIATSSAALASMFAVNGVQAAPTGLAAAAAHLALVGTASTAGNGLLATIAGFIMETKVKLAIATSLSALAMGIIVIQQRQNSRLRDELAAIRDSETTTSSRATNRITASRGSSLASPAATTVRSNVIALTDLEPVLAKAIRDKLWETDDMAFRGLIARIDNRDMPAALAYMSDHLAGIPRELVRERMVFLWTRRAPDLAAAWCQQFPATAEQQRLSQMVATNWAHLDPEAALRFAPNADAIHQLALHSPTQAENEALQFPPGNERNRALDFLSNIKLEQDPGSVASWIEKLGGDDRAVALSAILPQLTESDPSAVASYVEKLPPTDRVLQTGLNFAIMWAKRDPVAAADWSAALPLDSGLRLRTITSVASIWAVSDPTQAAAWISGLPAGHAREVAAKAYVNHVAVHDPALAATMVSQLGAEARAAAIGKIRQSWLKSDPDAARQWLSQMNLSGDQAAAPGAEK